MPRKRVQLVMPLVTLSLISYQVLPLSITLQWHRITCGFPYMPGASYSFQLGSYSHPCTECPSRFHYYPVGKHQLSLSRHPDLTSEKAVLTHRQLILIEFRVPVHLHVCLPLLDSKLLEGKAVLLPLHPWALWFWWTDPGYLLHQCARGWPQEAT